MIEEEIAKKSRMKEKCTVRNVPTDDRLKTIRIELIGNGDDDDGGGIRNVSHKADV